MDYTSGYQYFVCPKCGRVIKVETPRCYEPNITCTCDLDAIDKPLPVSDKQVGIDVGLEFFAVTSTVYQMVEVTDPLMKKALEKIT